MGRLVINNSITVNGAFEAPVPEPDGWLVLDADSNQVALEQFFAADAMVLGRQTYEGSSAGSDRSPSSSPTQGACSSCSPARTSSTTGFRREAALRVVPPAWTRGSSDRNVRPA